MQGKITSLIRIIGKLPGVNQRLCKKIGFALLQNQQLSAELQKALEDASKVGKCNKCGMYTEAADLECAICSNPSRNGNYICVVSDMMNLLAIEKTKVFNGLYHMLHGVISHLDHIGPNDLNLSTLRDRISDNSVTEILIGLSPTTEGQATGYYIKSMLSDLPVQIKMLGVGVSIGSDLEYLDANTIAVSIRNRH